MAATATTRRERRRVMRQASRRRTRGGENRAPVAVQRIARQVDDAAFVAQGRVRRAFDGDRPLVLGLIGLLAAGALVISGPLSSYMDQRDRVVLLEQQLAALEGANGDLQQRSADLADPEHQELIAREQLGYVMPGEVPYVVVPPNRDTSTFADTPEVEADLERPWFRRAWDTVTGLFS